MSKKVKEMTKLTFKRPFERMEASELVFKIVAYAIVTVFALACIYPIIYTFSAAFSGGAAVLNGKVVLWPIGFQTEAFMAIITNKLFWIGYASTLFVTVFGTVYCMGLSILGAYALSKKRLVGHKLFNFLLIFTMWFSAGIIPMSLNFWDTRDILMKMGIVDQKWVIVIAMGMAAFNIILLRNAFDSVPKEIEEAATVDGANDVQIMSKIYVPMSKATVATVALFYGISRWNGYYWAQAVVQDSIDYPLQVYIQGQISYIAEQTADNGSSLIGIHAPMSEAYAMIICAILPILIIYPFIQKYFAAGVNVGGVKE